MVLDKHALNFVALFNAHRTIRICRGTNRITRWWRRTGGDGDGEGAAIAAESAEHGHP